MSVGISAYDHVGIRVADRDVAIGFYGKLGFELVPHLSNDRVAELVAGEGVRIALIFNGERGNGNVLMDEPRKWPGYTHAAFVVEDLDTVIRFAQAEGVRITEGPVDWGRRITCFLRDPDGNVLEFNQLTGAD